MWHRLWQSTPVALVVESLIVLVSLWLLIPGAGLSRTRKVSLVVLAFTAIGMTIAPPPPSDTAMAVSSLVTIIVVGMLAWWFGRLTRGGDSMNSIPS